MYLNIPVTLGLISQIVESKAIAVGCQGFVSFDGDEAEFAIGIGSPGREMTSQTVWRMYCSGKPMLAIVIACLVERKKLSLDDAVSKYVYEFSGSGKEGITLRHVLNHTAGLDILKGLEAGMYSRHKRHHLVSTTVLGDDFIPGMASSFSEYAGWHLLGCVVETVTGKSYGKVAFEILIDPLLMTSTIYGNGTKERYNEINDRIGVFYDLTSQIPTPMLYDRSESLFLDWNPGYGSYSTARDMGKFYIALLAGLNGCKQSIISSETAHTFTQIGRGILYDPILERGCDFGLGFMLDLSSFGLGSYIGKRSFGHLGVLGSTWSFCDPDNRLVVSLVFNGWGEAGLSRTARISVMDSLYRELGITGCL